MEEISGSAQESDDSYTNFKNHMILAFMVSSGKHVNSQ